MANEGQREGMIERTTVLGLVHVRVCSYPIGMAFSCRVDNVDPGANIARGRGKTRQEAEENAIASAELTLELRGATHALRVVTDRLRR